MAKDRQGSYYATKPDLSNVGRLQVYKASEGRAGFSLVREYADVPRRTGRPLEPGAVHQWRAGDCVCLTACSPGLIDDFKRWRRGQEGLN